MGEIQPARVTKMAASATSMTMKKNALLGRTCLANGSKTRTTAGLKKRSAGPQAMDECGNLIGKDARRTKASAMTAKDA